MDRGNLSSFLIKFTTAERFFGKIFYFIHSPELGDLFERLQSPIFP